MNIKKTVLPFFAFFSFTLVANAQTVYSYLDVRFDYSEVYELHKDVEVSQCRKDGNSFVFDAAGKKTEEFKFNSAELVQCDDVKGAWSNVCTRQDGKAAYKIPEQKIVKGQEAAMFTVKKATSEECRLARELLIAQGKLETTKMINAQKILETDQEIQTFIK